MVDHSTVCRIGKGERAPGVGVVVAPTLSAYTTGGEIVHARLHTLIAEIVVRAEGIDLVWSYLTEILDEFSHFVNAAPKFITQSKHPEGWMMTIPAQDILALFVEKGHQRVILLIETTPERQFRLQDNTQLVCCDESSLWGTPGVEAHMVQTVGSTIAEVAAPRVNIHRHMARQWPDTSIVLATKEDFVPVGIEVLSLDMEVLEVRIYFLRLR